MCFSTADQLQETRGYHRGERTAQGTDQSLLERALQAEMTDHLGYEKHDPAGHHRGNTRNGKGQKTLKGEFGELELETPRDRPVGSFGGGVSPIPVRLIHQ